MARFLLLLGILPVILGIIARKWFGERRLREHRDVRCQLDAGALAQKLCKHTKLPEPNDSGRRSRTVGEEVSLAKGLSAQNGRVALAETGLLVGLALLARRQPELVAWRESSLKFSWAFPAFSLLVVIFAVLAGSLTRWALPISVWALALGTISGWLAVWVDWQAASLTAKVLESQAIIAREDDRIAIERSMKALSAKHFVPGLMGALFADSHSRKTRSDR